MLKQQNSTGAAGKATTDRAKLARLVELFEARGNLLARTDAATQLSKCLMTDLEFGFLESRARKQDGRLIDFTFDVDNIETTKWLAAEVWDTSREIRKLLDEAYDILAQLSDDERKAVAA